LRPASEHMDASLISTHRGDPAAEPIVRLSDVHLSLQSRAGRVDILRGIDLDIAEGVSVGIVGPSGSGKTTLLMAIAGLERISRGVIRVAGHDLTHLDEDALARFRRDHVGIVFQSFHLIATMTALENVAVPLEFRGLDDAAERARRELERVGLGHRLDHYPGQLSGGEQQRVAVARAVAAGAAMVMADEPTGNLDQQTGQEIMDLLFQLPREHGTTLLLVTHDRALADACDRVIEIRDGRITANER
jgi:putative ABC transport system ATP-binding protein